MKFKGNHTWCLLWITTLNDNHKALPQTQKKSCYELILPIQPVFKILHPLPGYNHIIIIGSFEDQF